MDRKSLFLLMFENSRFVGASALFFVGSITLLGGSFIVYMILVCSNFVWPFLAVTFLFMCGAFIAPSSTFPFFIFIVLFIYLFFFSTTFSILLF